MALNNLKYDPKFCDDILWHLEQGFTIESFSGYLWAKYQIRVTTDCVYKWFRKYEEFGEAKEIGRSCGLRTMEFQLKQLREGGEGNLGPLAFTLKTQWAKLYAEKKILSVGNEDAERDFQINIVKRDEK